MGRRDLVRRDRAKLAATLMHDTAELTSPQALPAWLGAGPAAAGPRSWAPATSTAQLASARTTNRRTKTTAVEARRRPSRFESVSLRDLAERRQAARALVWELDAEIAEAVTRARAAGARWSEVADHLGVTRQAARQRYVLGGAQVRRGGSSSTDPRLAPPVAAKQR